MSQGWIQGEGAGGAQGVYPLLKKILDPPLCQVLYKDDK